MEPTVHQWGQRLRYLTLLYFAVLITYASVEQAQGHADEIASRHLGALVGVLLLVVTMFVSIREHRARSAAKSRARNTLPWLLFFAVAVAVILAS